MSENSTDAAPCSTDCYAAPQPLRPWLTSLNEHDRQVAETAIMTLLHGFSEFPKHAGRQGEVVTESQLAIEHIGWDAATEAMWFFAALCMDQLDAFLESRQANDQDQRTNERVSNDERFKR